MFVSYSHRKLRWTIGLLPTSTGKKWQHYQIPVEIWHFRPGFGSRRKLPSSYENDGSNFFTVENVKILLESGSTVIFYRLNVVFGMICASEMRIQMYGDMFQFDFAFNFAIFEWDGANSHCEQFISGWKFLRSLTKYDFGVAIDRW